MRRKDIFSTFQLCDLFYDIISDQIAPNEIGESIEKNQEGSSHGISTEIRT
jgi:hypothetical protein